MRIASCLELVLLALLALAGCGVGDPKTLDEDPAFCSIRESAKTRGWVLRLGEAPPATQAGDDGEGWKLAVEGTEILDGAERALRDAGLFTEEGGDSNKGGHPLILTMDGIEAKASSEGKNAYFIPNLFYWWIISPFAASLVADEDFSATLKAHASLSEPGSASPVWEGVIETKFQGSLDHFQRGFTMLDLLPTGPLTARIDPESLSICMVPHLVRSLGIEIAKRLADELPPPQVHLLVAAGGGGKIAESDVREIVRMFETGEGKKETVVLKGEVTPESIRAALVAAAQRRDIAVRDVVFFYAGPGTLVSREKKAEPALCPAGKPRAVISVSEVLGLLKAIPAGSRCAILDTGFRGAGGRAVPCDPALKDAPVSPFETGKDAPCLICPAGPGEPGFESSEWGHGALTAILIPLLSKKGDADGDGQVKASEIFQEIRWELPRKMRLAGGAGTNPHLSGDGVLWRYVKPEASPPEKKDAGAK